MRSAALDEPVYYVPTIYATDAAVDARAETLAFDDGWETSVSTGIVDEERFPDFDHQVVRLEENGLRTAFWTSVGWTQDPGAAGLEADDLLHDRHGVICRVNWAMDPRNPARWRYALDPSSPRVGAFLISRTRAVIRRFRPMLLKLDFGYGLPGPDTAASRNPALRGERMGQEFYRIISRAAHDEDPDTAVLLYGIHPLHTDLADVVSLDDMGDHGDEHEGEGHRHWSVWASLLSGRGIGINASSGYNWAHDDEVILDTAVLGAPGAVLPFVSAHAVPARLLARRRAINRWHRRTVRWEPLWLDSVRGTRDRQPRVNDWGRLESGRLTALALRGERGRTHPELDGIAFSGRWAVVALDEADLRRPRGRVAAIPLSAGELRLPAESAPTVMRYANGSARPDAVSSSSAHLNTQVVLTATDAELERGLEGWELAYPVC